jgi:hypothetical protein
MPSVTPGQEEKLRAMRGQVGPDASPEGESAYSTEGALLLYFTEGEIGSGEMNPTFLHPCHM